MLPIIIEVNSANVNNGNGHRELPSDKFPLTRSGVESLPKTWGLVAIDGVKTPYQSGWQKNPLSSVHIIDEVRSGRCKAVGVICGSLSGGLLFFDHDGPSCDDFVEKITGQSLADALPITVSVTSGRLGRYQNIYQVPEQYWSSIKKEVKKTGVIGDDGKPEQIEFRWDGHQSVVMGAHPMTGGYRWVIGRSPVECAVADAPMWMIEQMLKPETKSVDAPTKSLRNLTGNSDLDKARKALSQIPNQDLDWERWRDTILALHGAGVSESEARSWSAGSMKHTDRGFDSVWKHIKDDKQNNLGVGSLILWAKENERNSGEYSQVKPKNVAAGGAVAVESSAIRATPTQVTDVDSTVMDEQPSTTSKVLKAAISGELLPLKPKVDKKGEITGWALPSSMEIARYISVKNCRDIRYNEKESRFFRYNETDGYWIYQTDVELLRLVGDTIGNTIKKEDENDIGKICDAFDLAKDGTANAVIKMLPMKATDTPDPLPTSIVPFVGSWYHLGDKIFGLPSREYFVTNPLPIKPVKGDCSADDGRIGQWLIKALDYDQGAYDLIKCLFWLVMTGDVSRQVYYEIIGAPRTGKGTLVELLSHTVGPANKATSDLGLMDSEKSQFDVHKLYGKRLVLFPEQKRSGNSSQFLKKYTGQDDLNFNRKKDPDMFDFKGSGIIVITGNSFLRFDENCALDARRIPIKFDVKPTKEEKDQYPDFLGHLLEHLEGWLHHILDLDKTWVYDQIENRRELTKTAILEQTIDSNIVGRWLNDECVVLDNDKKTYMGKKDDPDGFYKSYIQYCFDKGHPHPVAQNQLSNDMRDFLYQTVGWSETEIAKDKDYKGAYWKNLTLRTPGSITDKLGNKGRNPVTKLDLVQETEST